jgi:HAD superfamily hydrolase (TIGR01509 family)
LNRIDAAAAFADAAPIDFVPAAVLFDMDGLLIESERVLLECWRIAARERALDLDDGLWLSMIGLHEAACRQLLIDRVGAAHASALVDELEMHYGQRVEAGLPVKADAPHMLDWLARCDVPRAVATSTARQRALLKLERGGLLSYFSAVACGDEVEHPKPAPDVYLLAARRLDVDPARCVVLEDSAPGVRAALAAGMTPIQVPDLVAPDAATRALGHRIAPSLRQAQALLAPALVARVSTDR